MRKLLYAFAFLFAALIPLAAQDVRPPLGAGPYKSLARRSPWADLSKNYIFSPGSSDQAYCIFVFNNNPTNAHPITLEASQTGDPNTVSYQGNTGRWTDDTVEGNFTTVAAASLASAYVRAYAAAKIAVRISGTGALAGTPDTADVWVVETRATSCGPVAASGNPASAAVAQAGVDGSPATTFGLFTNARAYGWENGGAGWDRIHSTRYAGLTTFRGLAVAFAQRAVGLTPDGQAHTGPWAIQASGDILRFMVAPFVHNNTTVGWDALRGTFQVGVATTSPLVVVSDSNSRAFEASIALVNPAAAEDLLNVNAGATRTLYFVSAEISHAEAANQTFEVDGTTAAGATCTAITASNLDSSSATVSDATVNRTCTTNPTVQSVRGYYLKTSDTVLVVDLRGRVARAGSGDGITINAVTDIAGTVYVRLKWYED